MDQQRLTIEEHLEELRRRLIIGLVAVGIASVICFLFAEKLLSFLIQPVGKLVFITPTEVFLTYLKFALFGGLFIAMPVVIFEIWGFVSSGLAPHEKKYALIYGPFSLLLFLTGIAFAYFVVLPLGLKFLLSFAPQNVKPMISVANYVSFASMFLLAFGLVFEVPLIILFLTKIGLVTPTFLSRNRKYIILATFIAAAIFTPPDIVTQVLLAVPLLGLFEFSLLLSRFIRVKQ